MYRPAWVVLMENSSITVLISGAQVKRLRNVKVKASVADISASQRLLLLFAVLIWKNPSLPN